MVIYILVLISNAENLGYQTCPWIIRSYINWKKIQSRRVCCFKPYLNCRQFLPYYSCTCKNSYTQQLVSFKIWWLFYLMKYTYKVDDVLVMLEEFCVNWWKIGNMQLASYMSLHFYAQFQIKSRYSYHLYSTETQATSRSLLVLDSSTKILGALEHINIKYDGH